MPFRLKDIPIKEIYEFPEQAKIVKSSAVGHEKGSEHKLGEFALGFRRRMCSEAVNSVVPGLG